MLVVKILCILKYQLKVAKILNNYLKKLQEKDLVLKQLKKI